MSAWVNPKKELIDLSKSELRELLIKKLKKFKVTKIVKAKKYDSQVLFSYDGRSYTGFLGANNKIRIHRVSGDFDVKDINLQDELNALDVEGVEKVSKEIRDKSTKLPKKKMRLKEWLENYSQ